MTNPPHPNSSGNNNETQFFGAQGAQGGSGAAGDRPRQYFPGEFDPNQPSQPQPPQPAPAPSSYTPPQPAPQKSGKGLTITLGILAALFAIIAGVLFALWRGAASDTIDPADIPTSTVTTTQETTVTETTTDGGLLDRLPPEIRDLNPETLAPGDLAPTNPNNPLDEQTLNDLGNALDELGSLFGDTTVN